ncbi:NADP-dependent 3-hydroxy acid dehydrogenase YdfG [Sporobacter termitidis DSM 10068]|uniref:NADP-dependent 3-hydroxy acid dehydrogenase YdfG n=1 Tax=Sporobacter termitidis DSM 10068 TaxID=1123282 RepID=A0A1M5UIV6_9FIRM|nr:SDR family NAD(P)-dependent oxidoreductase [Sporobacter termitidis]SHH62917.1 NADP-dependent 3-hydroxy acid dehydrogenase YdfG [Sporobacter termitidis DSM 10068]
MKDFAGKIAFITGGASGAGLGQAKLFGGLGAKVTIVDIRQEAIDKAVAELKGLGIDALGIQMDLTNRPQYTAAADAAEKHWGAPPQLLIQTAGVNTFGPAEASTFEDYDWVLGVNLHGVVNGMVIFVPRMIKAYNTQNGTVNRDGGHIAIVSSMGAFDGFATDAPYSVSKAAVLNLGLSYYDALKPYGIGVTVQCPANINSNIGEAVKTRPASLSNTGYYVSEGTINMLKSIHAQGMDPVELAGHLKYAMENGLPVSLPHDPEAKMVRHSLEKVINFSSVEGMERVREEEKRMAEMMKNMPDGGPFGKPDPKFGPVEVFGQAKPDLEWVDTAKKKH